MRPYTMADQNVLQCLDVLVHWLNDVSQAVLKT